ncbi:hypothetical protein BC332_15746 [Capsicum chinense]|nr:hypothetical protein BC332_15746 [Capsicum chinense]
MPPNQDVGAQEKFKGHVEGCYRYGAQGHCPRYKGGYGGYDISLSSINVTLLSFHGGPKCQHLDDANKVSELMEVKDMVSWNALVTGYSQIGRFDETLGLFERMREEEIELNVVTWSVVISVYAQRDLDEEDDNDDCSEELFGNQNMCCMKRDLTNFQLGKSSSIKPRDEFHFLK